MSADASPAFQPCAISPSESTESPAVVVGWWCSASLSHHYPTTQATMSHALARMAHRFRGLCQGWRRAGMLAALPQTRRQRVTRSLMLACSWAAAHTRKKQQRSLSRACSFASPSSVPAHSRAAGAAHSGRYRDVLPLVAYPDSWQTRWRAATRHHDFTPKTPALLKSRWESGSPYRGCLFCRLTRPQHPDPALSARQSPRNRLLLSSDGGALLRYRTTIRPRRLR